MTATTNHSEQVQRIKAKLKQARAADKQLKVFGASQHKYRIGSPKSEKDVCEFEQRYSVTLPACYRAFVTQVGDGRSWLRKKDSAAGPFYGIYPLGKNVGEILEQPESFFKQPAIIAPEMTEEEWDTLADDSNAGWRKIYAGVLPLGSQGCAYIHTLVLNGPHQGRVANLNLDGGKPKFAFEANFLDWYERWLDEVISGDLMQDGPYWFGYTMGGNDKHLLGIYANATNRKTKLDALNGLAKLSAITEASCEKLLAICGESDAELRRLALEMLTKLAYPLAREPLRQHIAGDDGECLAACQILHCYAKRQAKEWVGPLIQRLPTVKAPETFRYLSFVLVNSGADFSADFKPFCTHEEEDIRNTAFYSLGKLANKKDLVDLFIVGLNDVSERVVHTTLQALEGVRDQRLREHYSRVFDRFDKGGRFNMHNLEARMKENGSYTENFRR